VAGERCQLSHAVGVARGSEGRARETEGRRPVRSRYHSILWHPVKRDSLSSSRRLPPRPALPAYVRCTGTLVAPTCVVGHFSSPFFSACRNRTHNMMHVWDCAFGGGTAGWRQAGGFRTATSCLETGSTKTRSLGTWKSCRQTACRRCSSCGVSPAACSARTTGRPVGEAFVVAIARPGTHTSAWLLATSARPAVGSYATPLTVARDRDAP